MTVSSMSDFLKHWFNPIPKINIILPKLYSNVSFTLLYNIDCLQLLLPSKPKY